MPGRASGTPSPVVGHNQCEGHRFPPIQHLWYVNVTLSDVDGVYDGSVGVNTAVSE